MGITLRHIFPIAQVISNTYTHSSYMQKSFGNNHPILSKQIILPCQLISLNYNVLIVTHMSLPLCGSYVVVCRKIGLRMLIETLGYLDTPSG